MAGLILIHSRQFNSIDFWGLFLLYRFRPRVPGEEEATQKLCWKLDFDSYYLFSPSETHYLGLPRHTRVSHSLLYSGLELTGLSVGDVSLRPERPSGQSVCVRAPSMLHRRGVSVTETGRSLRKGEGLPAGDVRFQETNSDAKSRQMHELQLSSQAGELACENDVAGVSIQ